MTEAGINEIIENPQTEYYLDLNDFAYIMEYKSKNIKAHIPAWVFKELAFKLYDLYEQD